MTITRPWRQIAKVVGSSPMGLARSAVRFGSSSGWARPCSRGPRWRWRWALLPMCWRCGQRSFVPDERKQAAAVLTASADLREEDGGGWVHGRRRTTWRRRRGWTAPAGDKTMTGRPGMRQRSGRTGRAKEAPWVCIQLVGVHPTCLLTKT